MFFFVFLNENLPISAKWPLEEEEKLDKNNTKTCQCHTPDDGENSENNVQDDELTNR